MLSYVDMMFEHLLTSEVQEFIRMHLSDDVTTLALRARQYPSLPLTDIIRQIQARQKAQAKLPGWCAHERVIFPIILSLEQSSSETTAAYKASLVSGNTLVDLTGGLGVDSFYFSKQVKQVIHLEQNSELSTLAAHNFRELGAGNITCLHADAAAFLANLSHQVDVFYLDPARRDRANGKVFRLDDCEPDVLQLLPILLEKAHTVWLKTSPMLDIELAVQQLKAVKSVTVVAVNNECKEVLYQLCAQSTEAPILTAANLLKNGQADIFTFSKASEQQAEVTFSEALTYLYEPNAALLKAGAFQSVAQRFGLYKLHQHTHLYTSDTLQTDFPGRIFRCEGIMKLDKKVLLAVLPDGKANLTVRNFPMSVADIRRLTGIREGGEMYLFATTDLNNRKVVIVTRKVTA
jgi:16S rRNA G966 N2-methylase RsmD